jgi:N-acylneuraminate cytidylyltransferase/CMP-N,N'-diacetyllegionaminic acid synthase
MYAKKTFVAIIPARGGSKGVKNKNIKLLNGIPLIAYTIKAAKESGIFDKIIVSTDSKDIADIALQYGAEVPFLRPSELATDTATTKDVILHALDWMNKNDLSFDYFMLLQPTSPLRSCDNIKDAVKVLIDKDANAVISVCEVEHSPLWSNVLPENMSLKNFIRDDVKHKRRQDLPKYYRLNGAIYICEVNMYLKTKDWFSENAYAYVMPSDKSIDIDYEIDFKIAEILIKG